MRALRHSRLKDDDADETDINRAGGWSREQILRMDERSIEAVRRAHPVAEALLVEETVVPARSLPP